jgi:hypothetical protein
MKLKTKMVIAVGALALATAPATAPADPPSSHDQAGGHGPQYTPASEKPGPSAGLPEKTKAYGVYCKDQSKKHVAGQKGTPFSQCVTAMAKAANNENLSPGRACKEMSHKHAKGEKGTPFSRCVKGAAKLREAQQG